MPGYVAALEAQGGDTVVFPESGERPVPEWCMPPLVADYALAVGYVRAWLTDISVRKQAD